jgi:hypothetical protein
MHFFARIKESILYTWHGNDIVRDCIKNLTCPCFGSCYMLRDNDMTCTRVKKRAKRAKRNAISVIRRVTLATALHSRESHSFSTRFLHETHEPSDVWLLLGRMAQLKTVKLRYIIADLEYWRQPARRHFAMLEDATKMTEEAVFDVFYEIETRFEIEEGLKRSDGGQERDLLFEQWRVDEWTRVGQKDG